MSNRNKITKTRTKQQNYQVLAFYHYFGVGYMIKWCHNILLWIMANDSILTPFSL